MQRGSSNKNDFEIQVPLTHKLIHVSRLQQISAKAKKYDALVSSLSRSKYEGKKEADKMLGYAASIVPQCGYSGLATIIPFVVANLLTNADIPFHSQNLISSLPSPQKIQSLVTEHAVDTALLTLRSINSNPNVYLALDKGNKKGNKNLAKFFCWYDTEKDKVQTYLLDVDCVDEDTTDTFKGLEHSIKRFFAPNMTEESFLFRGQCTDSGGGGTLFALAKLIKDNNMKHESYLVGSCTLHNIQTALRNAVVNVLGEGGSDDGEYRMNVMQLLHGAYNLQNWHEIEELKEIWKFVQTLDENALTFKKLEEPVLTRWWLVGACAASFKESMHIWENICIGIRNSSRSNSASMKIASCTLNLLQKPVIINDLELLVAFHRAFLFPHFQSLQLGDPRTGNKASFIARHIAVRYFLMIEDLEKMEGDEWMNHEMFISFLATLNILNEEEKIQQKKITLFLKFIRQSIEKHFKQWIDRLFFLGIWADQPMGKAFARKIIGNAEVVRNEFKYCDFHDRNIDLHKFDGWIQSNVSNATVMTARTLPSIRDNYVAVTLVALGHDMWSPTIVGPLLQLRQVFLREFSSFPTNTQFVERGVKESGYVSLGRRAENNRTILAIARGKVLPEVLRLGHLELDNLSCEEDDKEEGGKKKHQLKGKRKTKHLMNTIFFHTKDMKEMKEQDIN